MAQEALAPAIARPEDGAQVMMAPAVRQVDGRAVVVMDPAHTQPTAENGWESLEPESAYRPSRSGEHAFTRRRRPRTEGRPILRTQHSPTCRAPPPSYG
jgi:hypothetical protein